MNGKKTILVKAPVLSRSGYGQQSRFAIKALRNHSDYKILIQNIPWGNTSMIVEDTPFRNWIDQNIQNTIQFFQQGYQPDASLQITVPNELEQIAEKNILYTAGIETDQVAPQWIEKINEIADKVVTISEHSKRVFEETDYEIRDEQTDQVVQPNFQVQKPVSYVNYPYRGIDDPIDLDLDLKHDFNFLTVAQWSPRKNLESTIKWFVQEFFDRNVGLVIKGSIANNSLIDRRNLRKRIKNILDRDIYEGRNCSIHIIHGHLKDEEMLSLYHHDNIRAYMTTTHGEGFCTLGHTKIITENGRKRIDEINEGEKVLTHKGRFKKVTNTLNRDYEGKMYKIDVYKGQDIETVALTPNHNLYVWNNSKEEFEWKQANEVSEGEYAVLPEFSYEKNGVNIESLDLFEEINNCSDNIIVEGGELEYAHSNKMERNINIPKKIDITPEFMKLLGYYLSEGSIGGNSVNFTIHENEASSIGEELVSCMEEVFGVNKHTIREYENKKCIKFQFYSQILCCVFENLVGTTHANKSIPQFVFGVSDKMKSNFISSLYLGDGYIGNKEISLELVNNKEVIRDIRSILWSLGIASSYDYSQRSGKVKDKWDYNSQTERVRTGRILEYNKFIDLINRNHLFASYKKRSTEFLAHATDQKMKNLQCYRALGIKNINEIDHDGEVYNLSVEEDESYCTDNFVVHNCLPIMEAASAGMPVIAPDWSGHTDYLYKDDKPFFANVDYEIKQISEEAQWDGMLVEDSNWAYADEGSFKLKARKVYKNYPKFVNQAKKLRKHLKQDYSQEDQMSEFVGEIDEVVSEVTTSLDDLLDDTGPTPRMFNDISFCIATDGTSKEKTNMEINSIHQCMEGNDIDYEIVMAGDVEEWDDREDVKTIDASETAHDGYLAELKNIAGRNSENDVIVFADDDLLFPEDWSDRLKEFSRDEGWEVLGNKILLPNGDRYWDRAQYQPHRMIGYDQKANNLYQTGCFWIMRREVFEEHEWDGSIPFYAEDDGGVNEDVEYSMRLQDEGYELMFDKENTVWHNDDSYAEWRTPDGKLLCLDKETIEQEFGVDFSVMDDQQEDEFESLIKKSEEKSS